MYLYDKYSQNNKNKKTHIMCYDCNGSLFKLVLYKETGQ